MTTTSYAILGLLAVKPWTTHELVVQVNRSLRLTESDSGEARGKPRRKTA